jgi:hypothetical protein
MCARPVVDGDLAAAGITVLLAAKGPSEDAKKGELYLKVKAAEGQDASTPADKLVSLVQSTGSTS